MPESTTIYEDDLAYIHDIGFSRLSESWAPGLLEILREAGIGDGTIIDLGCGGGGWAERLTSHGYDAIGIDVSRAMVELARRRVPTAEFHVGSIWESPLPKCRAVTALSEVVCYRAGDDDQPDLRTLLERIFEALEPGGLLLLDVTEVGLDRDRHRDFAEGKNWACLVCYEYDEAALRLHRHITAFRKVDAFYRRTHEHHIVQLYDADQVAGVMESVGFEVRQVRNFGDAPLLPLRAGFIGTRGAASR
jgi:SAM-dependent methyltransferase